MASSYKARARRHVLTAEKLNVGEAMERAKTEMENAKSPATFHAASAKYEELAGRMAGLKRKLKRKKKAKGFLGLW